MLLGIQFFDILIEVFTSKKEGISSIDDLNHEISSLGDPPELSPNL